MLRRAVMIVTIFLFTSCASDISGVVRSDGMAGDAVAAVAPTQSGSLIGKPVRSDAGVSLGRVEDIVVDAQSGQVSAVIVGVNAILGIRRKQIAVPWSLIDIDQQTDHVVIGMTRGEIEAAPNYEALSRRHIEVAPPSR